MINLKSTTLSYVGFYGKTFEGFISQAAELGFGGVQLIPDQYPNLYDSFSTERVRQIRKSLRDNGLAVSLHNVFYDINISSLVPTVQDFALSVTRDVARLGAELGATALTVHPGYMFPGWRSNPVQAERFWAAAAQGMGVLNAIAQESSMRLCLENGSYFLSSKASQRRVPLHIGVTADEMSRLLSATGPNVGVCLDVGKVHASEESLDAFISLSGDKLFQVQIGSRDTVLSVIDLEARIAALAPEIVFEGGLSGIEALREVIGQRAGSPRS